MEREFRVRGVVTGRVYLVICESLERAERVVARLEGGGVQDEGGFVEGVGGSVDDGLEEVSF